MKTITFIKVSVLSLVTLATSQIANATDLAQIQVTDSNVKYAKCMDASPIMKTDKSCTANANCGQTTISSFYAKEAYELNCHKQYGGPSLTYTFVDH